MKKYLIALSVILLILLISAGGGIFYVNYLKNRPSLDKEMKEAVLSHEDVANITKPSIVRLMQHIKGKAELPDIKIDFEKFDVIPNPSGPKKSIDVDEYLVGSGFVVNGNGYILTNSHVVSYQTIKNVLAGLQSANIISREAISYVASGKKDPNAGMSDLKAQEMGEQLGRKIINYFTKEGKFELDKKVVVLNPAGETSDKEKMFNDGFPASIVSVNDNFFNDSHDVALVKIDQDRLPPVKLGDSSNMNIGNKIMIFGFPGSADFNGKNFLESTFTDGAINSIKDSDNKDFKIFQSDAKISQGSSGGPMINEQGEIIGIITYGSNPVQRGSGDGFGFALPITDASSWINGFVVNSSLNPSVLNDSSYFDHFLNGLRFSTSNRCQKAIAEFNLAKNMNSNFSTDKYLKTYIDKCNSVISSGQSIDTQWDEKKQELGKINKSTWYIASGGILILTIAIFIILFLIDRLKKDEKEMHILEDQFHSQPNYHENVQSASTSVSNIKSALATNLSSDAKLSSLQNPDIHESEVKIEFK
jgi:S1-C subfamily serine protease